MPAWYVSQPADRSSRGDWQIVGARRATWLAERTVGVRGRSERTFSTQEETVIRRFLERLGSFERYAVDIPDSFGGFPDGQAWA
jgi:hypothetical protein